MVQMVTRGCLLKALSSLVGKTLGRPRGNWPRARTIVLLGFAETILGRCR